MLGTDSSIMASRLAYFLDLKGPALAINTACSSSLAAINIACEQLKSQTIDFAIAGGITIFTHPGSFIMMNNAGMLSPAGTCLPFDKKANGIVVGDGIGIVILKRLSEAEKDGDFIYGVIKGIGINQDGQTSGITVPNFLSQSELETSVYENNKINVEDIQYIETHGTGTPLGDPIEIHALTKSFRSFTNKTNYCAIGSLKANIGHTTAASGVLSLIKVLLGFQNQKVPPSINFSEGNTQIDFDRSPFYVNTTLKDWPLNSKNSRLAAVSSFGFSGTNAHLVVEEYINPDSKRVLEVNKSNPVLIILSARNEERLKEYAQKLLNFIKEEEQTGTLNLRNIAYTLQVGREAMEERLGFLATSTEEIKEQLLKYIQEEKGNFHHENVSKNKEIFSDNEEDLGFQSAIKIWLEQRNYEQLLKFWVQGLDIDWSKLYREEKLRRVPLPTYPFAREQYWIEEGKAGVTHGKQHILHPLVHENTSTLSKQRFSTTLTGDEFFLKDHVVNGQKILPGVAYLEMAREAVRLSLGKEGEEISLQDVVWITPIAIEDKPKKIDVSILPEENGKIAYEIYTEESGETIIHSQGKAIIGVVEEEKTVDLGELKALCQQGELSGEEFYKLFEEVGVKYGPSHRGIEKIYLGEGIALAKIQLPELISNTIQDYKLHPSLMDMAFQTTLGIMLKISPSKFLLPFSLHTLKAYSFCKHSVWVFIKKIYDKESDLIKHVNIEIIDKDGKLLILLEDLLLKITDKENYDKNDVTSPVITVPLWEVIPKKFISSSSVTLNTLLIGGDAAQRVQLQQNYPTAQYVDISPGASVEEIANTIGSNQIDHLIFIAPNPSFESVIDSHLMEDQIKGVFFAFKIFKALIKLGYDVKELAITAITFNTQQIGKNNNIDPTHAGLHGLIGSLAKEYKNWKVTLLDLDIDCEIQPVLPLSIPKDLNGITLAYRHGEWFKQSLSTVVYPPSLGDEESVYKHGGVYVIIGGAGGIGEVLTKWLIDYYESHVIWIGRREQDAIIQAKIDSFGTIKPEYIQANATSFESLHMAYEKIKAKHDKINGIVHSAIVLSDATIATMTEEQFRRSFSAKADVCVQIGNVFGKENLDFLLFFSSMQSFIRAAGQSNYAAGCVFKDAFAKALSKELSAKVKIMNWGYWGKVGIVATDYYQKLMEDAGIGSIESEEGMKSIELLMKGPLEQVGLIKIKKLNSRIEEGLLSKKLNCYPKKIPSICQTIANFKQNKSLDIINHHKEQRDDLIEKIKQLSLKIISVYLENYELIRKNKSKNSYLNFWIQESNSLIKQNSSLLNKSSSIEKLWNEWHMKKVIWIKDTDVKAKLMLLEPCLKAVPEILDGKRLATDVIFPNSSMELVEGIYKGNTLSDQFNDILIEAIVSYVQKRVKDNPKATLRFLEIGAGTGGTTEGLLAKLTPYQKNIGQYFYTDLSKAFLLHAEDKYVKEYPFVVPKIFDITRSPLEQGIDLDDIDVVIATNVLHATPKIRQTLQHAKQLLHRHGIIAINEISRHSWFAHLTFGLLEGWWLSQDKEIRIPGSPGLYPETWKHILEEEGLKSVFFPAQQLHDLGQQVIIAESDGNVKIITYSKKISLKEESSTLKKEIVLTKSDFNTVTAIQHCIKSCVSNLLNIQENLIDNDTSFLNYGIDSILGVQLINTINKQLNITLPTSILFEYDNIHSLTEHIVKDYQENSNFELIQDKARVFLKLEDQFQKESHLSLDCTTNDNKNLSSALADDKALTFPLSPSQERLWFLSKYYEDSVAYHVPMYLKIFGKFDIEALNYALTSIINRHEPLRTNFQEKNGKIFQIINKSNFKLTSLDVTDVQNQEQLIKKDLNIELNKPFNLEVDQLIRAKLYKIAEKEYRLLIDIHHIVFDAWSVALFIKELSIFYQFYKGKNKDLLNIIPPLFLHYKNYSMQQKKNLLEDSTQKKLVYWHKKLSGSPILNLPTTYPRPKEQSHRGSMISFEIDNAVTTKLEIFSKENQTTLFIVLLSIFNVLLKRYSGQEDIVIGTPVANRNNKDIETLIGLFVNTIALRNDLSGNPTFIELLNKIKLSTIKDFEHQDVPFEKIVEALKIERSTSFSPLFQVMFILQSNLQSNVDIPGLYIDFEEIRNKTSKFDLTMEIVKRDSKLIVNLEYNIDLFSKNFIESMILNFNQLIISIIENPYQKINELDILNVREKQNLLNLFNNTDSNYPKDKCIHHLFSEQAKKTPDNIAILFEDKKITYQELDQQSTQLALYLQSVGVKPDDLIGIYTERSIEMIVGLLGILKSGGAYVPLDPAYPMDRTKYILNDIKAKLIITQHTLKEKINILLKEKIKCLIIDECIQKLKSTKNISQQLKENVRSDNLAYVIYTSGSTGVPKGVMIEHRNTAAFISWAHDIFNLKELSLVLASTSLAFDLSIFEIFVPLTVGGSIRLVNNALELVNDTYSCPVTLINTVPSIIEVLLDEHAIPSTAKTINLAGELLEQKTVERLYKIKTIKKVFDLYGPSEDTTYSTFILRKPNQKQTIGAPISNTKIYIIDDSNQLVPIGVTGEICITGAGLARGYLHQPAITKEKFVVNSFGINEKHQQSTIQRLYKTGDIGRWLPNGNIEYIGRKDNQIKLRGFRIELGEIETVLNKHPKIKNNVVVVQTKNKQKELICFYISNKEKIKDSKELKLYLQKYLPDYMIPSSFIELKEIPLTSNGKVNRKLLEKTTIDLSENINKTSPKNKTEERIVKIFADVLNINPKNKIDIKDNFFDLGGNSLLSVKVVSEINKLKTTAINIADLINFPTPELLSELILSKTKQKDNKAVDPIDWEKEIFLENSITPATKFKKLEKIDSVLLTGANGFLGGCLLNELLQQTTANIYCIVRAKNVVEAKAKLMKALAPYGIKNKKIFHRIKPILGDLSKKLLGLSKEKFEDLSHNIDLIYHNGSNVNFIYPYSSLRPANVDSTKEIIKLACSLRTKPLYYISTKSVAEFNKNTIEHAITGYEKSKWVAEQLVEVASLRGLPTMIFRPPVISGHSIYGFWNTGDFLCSLFKGSLEIGAIPNDNKLIDLAPVDFIAKSIIYFSLKTDHFGKIFNLSNSSPIKGVQVAKCFAEYFNPKLKIVAPIEWINKAITHIKKTGESSSLYPFLPIFLEFQKNKELPEVKFYPNDDFLLTGSGVQRPLITENLLKLYFSYFNSIGFIIPKK